MPQIRRLASVFLASFTALAPAFARHEGMECGTTHETAGVTEFLHRQAVRARALHPRAVAPRLPNQDIGDIAVMQDVNGAIERLNQFNLGGNTLVFTPVSDQTLQYRYMVNAGAVVDSTAGIPLAALDDDDSRLVPLPFPFPFYGKTYKEVYVNSDGNLTFGAPDHASTDRSLGRMTAGPPRIAPLFDDLNPGQTTGGVQVLSGGTAFSVRWSRVPEYSDTNSGAPQTFQVWLYPDGRIQFSFAAANPVGAVVGISPGNLMGTAAIRDFRSDVSEIYASTVAEVFGSNLAVDVITVAQQFYETHDDAYDYLAIYNNLDVPAQAGGVVAFEETVRNNATGIGFPSIDSGALYGSASRLQAVLNLGPLGQYPADPNALVPARSLQNDTPLTILAHEAGHRFLAYASVRDPADAAARPMLGYQNAHWSFLFNSEASLLEGERIEDKGAGASPRFLTTDITQAYAPLDQYLMGFRAPPEVPDTFLVQNPSPNYAPATHQLSGIPFNGTRRDVTVADVIQAEGRRTPDETVAQRRFRFGIILLVAAGTQPSAAELAKVDTWRRQFEQYYAQASSGRASAYTTLKRSLKLSLFPAAGVVQGTSAPAMLTVETPPASDLKVQFVAPNGNAKLPVSVTIPAGALAAGFQIAGVRAGVEEVQAVPLDPSYETAFARVQVADASMLKLTTSVNGSSVSARVTDANNLPYAGMDILAIPSTGGAVVPADAFTDAQGLARFEWNPGSEAVSRLQLVVNGAPAVSAVLSHGAAIPAITSVVNAASFGHDIAAGGLATIFGENLGKATLLLNGAALHVLSAADRQVNFYIPPDVPQGSATITAVASGVESSWAVDIATVAPGIFDGGVRAVDGGAIHAGGYIEIYCTGLGPTAAAQQTTVLTPTVFIGATPVRPVFSGIAPGLIGVYQLDVRVPADAAPGLQSLIVSVNNAHSNQTSFTVE